MALPDFTRVSKEFKNKIEALGIQREEVERLVKSPSPDAKKTKAALDAAAKLSESLSELVKNTPVPELERKRRIAEIDARIEVAQLLRSQEQDNEKRTELRRSISVLSGQKAFWLSLSVLNVSDLVDPDGENIGQLIEDANRDIAARHDLARVLKGVELALRVAAFGAAAAAKMAVVA